MPRLSLCGSVVALCLSVTGAVAESEAGLQEFIEVCASCHGIAGHGDGPLAEFMNVAVPDLTQIASANDGVFPMHEVIRIIDGRTGVRGHGSEMPVWGARYQAEISPETGEYGAELMVRGRVLALATHLEAIQE